MLGRKIDRVPHFGPTGQERRTVPDGRAKGSPKTRNENEGTEGPGVLLGLGKLAASSRGPEEPRAAQCFQAVLLNLVCDRIPRRALDHRKGGPPPSPLHLPDSCDYLGEQGHKVFTLSSNPQLPSVSEALPELKNHDR